MSSRSPRRPRWRSSRPGPDRRSRTVGLARWCRSWWWLGPVHPGDRRRLRVPRDGSGRPRSMGGGARRGRLAGAARAAGPPRSPGRRRHRTGERAASGPGPGGHRADRAAVPRTAPRAALSAAGSGPAGSAAGASGLDVRIEQRVAAMWAAGLVDEVARLAQDGLREGVTASRALGYRQVLELLDGQVDEAEAQRRTVVATRRFARRQDSWFRLRPADHLVGARQAGPGRRGPRGRRSGRLSLCTAGRSRRATGPRTTSSCWWTATPESR